jgi:uncharacterized membrane protein
MTKFRYIWEELKASFWFIPLLILVSAILAASLFIYMDHLIDYSPPGFLEYLFSGDVDSARSILTITAGAMIGIAGTVFSITLVVLTLASSQLGSRLLRNFMYDKLNQFVLGTYVSTFVYCLLVLISISQDGDSYFVPVIAVFVAIILAIAGIILLIVFIHHISASIHANKVISDISDSLLKNISKLFPDELGYGNTRSLPDVGAIKRNSRFHEEIKCVKSGYLQSVDSNILMALSRKENIILFLNFKPGGYVVKDQVISEVFSDEKISEKISKKIHKAFIIGKIRTPLQDAEFSIQQMVEIACRALSPGINDPLTAISCIDSLTSVICRMTHINFPSPYRYDEDGILRVVADSPTFGGMLDAAFNQIRYYAGGSPEVVIRLMESFVTINKFISSDQKSGLLIHAELTLNLAERTFAEPRDLNSIKERFLKLD